MNHKLFENIPLLNRVTVVMLDDFIASSSTGHRHLAHFAMMAREGNGFPLFEPGNMVNASQGGTPPFCKSLEDLGRSAGECRRALDNLGQGGS